MVTKIIDQQHLKAVCDVLAETNLGYTKTELTRLLQQSEIEILSDGKSSNAYGYTLGLNKRDWLYNCLAYLFFNSMQTDSERSEFTGLKELMEAIFHLVRNPAAHTPKINWKVEESKALDILTLISFTHKYLDVCHKMPGKP